MTTTGDHFGSRLESCDVRRIKAKRYIPVLATSMATVGTQSSTHASGAGLGDTGTAAATAQAAAQDDTFSDTLPDTPPAGEKSKEELEQEVRDQEAQIATLQMELAAVKAKEKEEAGETIQNQTTTHTGIGSKLCFVAPSPNTGHSQ